MLSQRRFTVHDPQAKPLTWPIPLTFYGNLNEKEQIASLLFDHSDMVGPSSKDPRKFNVHGLGYYRVKYGDASFRTLVDKLNDLSAPDQSNLLSDTWAEVRAELTPAKEFFNLAQTLHPAGTNPLVWKDVCGIANGMDALYVGGDQAARKTWHEAMVAVLNPLWEHVGWDNKDEEAAPDKELRATLIRQLGFFGDILVIEGCQERFNAFLKDPSALPPDIRAATCEVVGRYADEKTYDALLDQARKATDDEQKQLFYYALACANNPELAQRTLELTATDEIQGSFANRLIYAVATSGEHPAETLKFALANTDKLAVKISPMAKQLFVPNLYAAFSDAPRAEELEKYAKNPGAVADPTQVQKAAEAIRVRAELKKRLLPEIAAWAGGK